MKLALGTVQFGLNYGIANRSGQVSLPMVSQIIALARDRQIDVIDTAAAYGESEVTLGHVGIEGFRIVTKLPPLPGTQGDVGVWARRQLAESLKRLRVQSLHGLLLHRASDLLGPRGRQLFRVLEDWRANGQVNKIGVSIYSPSELDHVMRLGKIDLVQAPFNLIDRRLQTSGWLTRLKDAQVEIHVRSAFLQGLLLKPVGCIPSQFSPWSATWHSWAAWQEHTGCSALAACLAFPHSFAEVDRVVVGVDSHRHLAQILDALDATVPPDFPEIACDDERLVHPSRWSEL